MRAGTIDSHAERPACLPRSLTHSLARFLHTEIIDGKETAATIRQELKAEVDGLKAKCGKVPGLAVVLVGERKDSQTYVRNKKKACEEVGIVSYGTVGTWLAVSLPARERPHSLARSLGFSLVGSARHGHARRGAQGGRRLQRGSQCAWDPRPAASAGAH